MPRRVTWVKWKHQKIIANKLRKIYKSAKIDHAIMFRIIAKYRSKSVSELVRLHISTENLSYNLNKPDMWKILWQLVCKLAFDLHSELKHFYSTLHGSFMHRGNSTTFTPTPWILQAHYTYLMIPSSTPLLNNLVYILD